MRIAVDFATNDIRQVERTPTLNVTVPYNGRYAIPTPIGAEVQITSSSYILPTDGGDVPSLLAASLLAQYPMYSNIVFNFFLTAADVGDIDTTATGPSGESSRIQMGRAVGPAPTGIYPNRVAILSRNNAVAPPRPGCLVTDKIDIGPMTGGMGADEFMVWWQLYRMSNTDDIASDFGATSGENQPGAANIIETSPEPAALTVSVSNDDGVTWTTCPWLTPTDLGVFDTDVRLSFVNIGTNKLYLAAFAILF